jgi:hypothetical protein
MVIVKLLALVILLAIWLAVVLFARQLIRAIAVKIGLPSIPIFLYIIGGFILLIPILPVAEWVLKKLEERRHLTS